MLYESPLPTHTYTLTHKLAPKQTITHTNTNNNRTHANNQSHTSTRINKIKVLIKLIYFLVRGNCILDLIKMLLINCLCNTTYNLMLLYTYLASIVYMCI